MIDHGCPLVFSRAAGVRAAHSFQAVRVRAFPHDGNYDLTGTKVGADR